MVCTSLPHNFCVLISTKKNSLLMSVSYTNFINSFQTRTSSPIQIPRNAETYESTSLKGLYPVGEGADYAGGIVSAAVDGMHAGFAVAKNLGLCSDSIESILGKARSAGFLEY